MTACKSTACGGSVDTVAFSYDGEGHRTKIVATPAAGSPVTTTEFRYHGNAVVAEVVNGTVTREFVTNDAGTIQKVVVPAGQSDAGTYLVVWNGHSDATGLWLMNADGTLTLANSYTYGTWGAPTTSTHNGIGDLGFRYLYVGAYDVQWDDAFGLGLTYMHARHYHPALGRFLQPDPSRADGTLYAYAGNSPASHVDPDGKALIALIPLALLAMRIAAVVGAVAPAVQKIATTAPRVVATVGKQLTQFQHIIDRHTWLGSKWTDGTSVFFRSVNWQNLVQYGGYGRFETVRRWTNGDWEVVNTIRMNQALGWEAIRASSGAWWYRTTDVVTYVWRNGMLWTMYPGYPRSYWN